MKVASSVERGQLAERFARTYLEQKGLVFIDKNYRCQFGEIDLIMQDKEYLVFIEVRYRANEDYGGALASITMNKQRRLLATVSYYLQKNHADSTEIRFDVVGLSGCINKPKVDWIKDALDSDIL